MKHLKLIDDLGNKIGNAREPVLAWSGGKDSTLILELCRRFKIPIAVLAFHHLWTQEQSRFLIDKMVEHDLTVFHWSPIKLSYEPPHVRATYLVGGTTIDVLMDHFSDTRCGIDVGRSALKERHLQPGYIWDMTVVGTKNSDTHPLMPTPSFENVEGHEFWAPLWDWTDAEVLQAIDRLGIQIDRQPLDPSQLPQADTGNFMACMACVHVEGEVYCPKKGEMIRAGG